MTAETEKLLGELYGLRAGLSVYSQEAEKLRAIEDGYWNQERLFVYNVPRMINGGELYTEKGLKFYDDDAYIIDDAAHEAWELNENGSPEIERISKEYNFDWEKFNDFEEKFWTGKPTAAMEQKRAELYHIADKIYEKWLISDDAVSYAQKNYEPSAVRFVQNAHDRLKALAPEREAKVFPYVARTDELYKALQKEYAPVINERNWKHLDLILFALETGRADTLKEALQFTDGELRTQRIEQAIEKAVSQIGDTIRGSMASLGKAMQNCCNKLSAQIQDAGEKILASNRQILSVQKELVSGQKELISGQKEMLTEQRFTNALLAKADVSSAQLMEDVHRMRNNSDYLNMRLKNG